jgi:histidinol-phosphatase
MPDALQHRLTLALEAAEAAGKITLEHFNRPDLAIETKSDGSPVTEIDRAAETAIRGLIQAAFPDDAIEGEEHANTPGTSGYNWIIDPIDGTYSYIHGVPLYGTLIGLELNNQLALGIIHMPALDETVYAAKGNGAWHRLGGAAPTPARVSTTATLKDALVLTTSYDYYRDLNTTPVIDRIHTRAGYTRGWSDCYAAVLLATGRADAVIEPLVHPWDIAALFAVINEAGGQCTDWAGQPTIRTGTCVLSNGLLHQPMLELTNPRES